MLPRDPDASARRIRARLRELTGARVGVLISDSFGRAWRHGQCDVAIGCAGLTPLEDWRGRTDSVGRELQATWLAVADMIAATADLARAKDSREPVVIVEGLERFVSEDGGAGSGCAAAPPRRGPVPIARRACATPASGTAVASIRTGPMWRVPKDSNILPVRSS